MTNKNKYNDLTDLVDKLNSHQVSKDQLNEEEKEFAYFWENAYSPDMDTTGIKTKLEKKIRKEQKKKRFFLLLRASSIAASFLILFATGLYFYTIKKNNNTSQYDDLLTIAAGIEQEAEEVQDVTIITSDSQLNIANDALIRYTDEGTIEVGSELVEEIAGTTEYDQLIVPRGKRARLNLSDGTQLWVNSLSKVVYPRTFDDKIRSVYVQGEVYMEVAPDAERPFHVISDDFSLRVLGTQFNISNYGGNEETSIVLVEGSVEITDQHKNNHRMIPNDLLAIREGSIADVRQVNPEKYISWVKGILILDEDHLDSILHRLSIYYGVTIECGSHIAKEKVYGKLDLKDSITDVLECIQATVPFKIEKHQENIYLTR
ncbi:MAG: FecR domain-containing protein [Tannerellaceae bacterium]|nr:FecR domain-containing protein [Tannerellaceae bacterium]